MIAFWKVAILFGLGCWVGVAWLASPGTEYKTVDHYHTETKTVTHTRTVMPPACKTALGQAARMAGAAERINATSPTLLEKISDARIATIGQDLRKLNLTDRDIRAMADTTTGAIQTLATIKLNYRQAVKACEKASH